MPMPLKVVLYVAGVAVITAIVYYTFLWLWMRGDVPGAS